MAEPMGFLQVTELPPCRGGGGGAKGLVVWAGRGVRGF